MKSTPPYEQTWLSLTGICDKLRLSPAQVRTLARKGCLAVIGGKGGVDKRYLDPTPEYREQLRLGAIIHQRVYPTANLNEKVLLTAGECGELLGMTKVQIDRYLRKHAIPSVQVSKAGYLYSPMVVREAMLKRSKRKMARQLAPYLLSDMIEFFRPRLSEELSVIPTDAQFREDENLQLRLGAIVSESQKADFARKVKLAQVVVQILESVKEQPTSKTS